MDLIFKGIITGLILSIMIGPVFFVLLETSIRKGIKAAIFFDLGVLINDVVYILIAFFFYQQVSTVLEHEDTTLLQIVGGALFLAYGAYYFLWKKVDAQDLTTTVGGSHSAKSYILLFIKGFLLNLANPMVVFYWFSVMTLADGGATMDRNTAVVIFVAVILFTFFSIDLLKIMGAKKLRPLLNARRLRFLNKFIGIVFIVFGVALAARGILGY
jgi:threonine/homoserine/homoserine lactone efflux protein